jgi:hypothetical protein
VRVDTYLAPLLDDGRREGRLLSQGRRHEARGAEVRVPTLDAPRGVGARLREVTQAFRPPGNTTRCDLIGAVFVPLLVRQPARLAALAAGWLGPQAVAVPALAHI